MTRLKSTLFFSCMVTFVGIVLLAAYQHQNKEVLPPQSPNNRDWLDHRTKLLSEEGLIRFYDFEDERRSFGEFRNRGKHWMGDMQASTTQTPSEPAFRITEGRHNGSTAIQTDFYPLEARSYFASSAGFTVAAWIKHDGPGSVVGGNCPNAGTILALGDGVWAGWKFVLLYPSNVLAFELGRPKPETSVGTISVTRIPPKTWTHIAATWDNKFINLFVNGLLCGRVKYDGPYYEVKSFTKLRIGYVGNGLGSAVLSCDELAIFDHPKSAEEIMSLATDGEPIHSDTSNILQESSVHFIHKEWQESTTKTERALYQYSCFPKTSGVILYRLAEIQLESNRVAEAQTKLSAITNFPFFPQNLRSVAKFTELYSNQPPPLANLHVFPLDRETNSVNYENHLESSSTYESALIEYDFCLPLK